MKKETKAATWKIKRRKRALLRIWSKKQMTKLFSKIQIDSYVKEKIEKSKNNKIEIISM